MIARDCRSFAVVVLLPVAIACSTARAADADRLKIFSGEPRLLVVHGYSTSFHWPKMLQRKIDRHFEGQRVIEVKTATKGGTPIAKWLDVDTGEPREPWRQIVRPALAAKADRPAIVLGQQSLQWAFGDRTAGIENEKDVARIKRGADCMRKYVELLQADGADLVLLAAHIYKKPMEPAIGNERLALAELASRDVEKFAPGPDVWEPTRKLYPQAFADDLVHPNSIGAEVMAQLWFQTLLEYDHLDVPSWSRDELREAIESDPVPLRRSQGPSRGGTRRPTNR